jgi:hypothetical protein
LLAKEASDHEEKDDIDEEEAEHIEKELYWRCLKKMVLKGQ